MWFVIGDKHKKRFFRVPFFVDPAYRFVGYDVSGKPLLISEPLSVADKIGRVFVAGQGIVLSAEGPVETMVIRLRLVFVCQISIHMPFSKVAGLVSRSFKDSWQHDFMAADVHGGIQRNPIVDAGTVGSAPGH